MWTTLQIKLVIALIICTTPAYAGESTLVQMSDNTTIKTKVTYEPAYVTQFKTDDPVEIKDPMGDATCFDAAIHKANRRDRYTALDHCLG